MKRWLGSILAAAFLLVAPAAQAANSTVPAMTAASALGGTELLYAVQGGADRKATPAQMAAYVYGLMSGDATTAAGGAITFTTVNANVGSFGSATACTVITVNAKGLITAVSTVTCTPAMSSVTGRAALSQLPQGIANSIWINPTGSTADMQNVAVPACANDGLHALVYVNGSGLACATLTAGGVTSIAANTGAFTLNGTSGITNATNDIKCQVSSASQFGCVKPDGTTITAAAGVLTSVPGVTSRTVTGTPDTILAADRGNIVYYNSASAVAVSQPTPSGSFAAGFFTTVCSVNTGLVTLTAGSGGFGSAATFTSTYTLPVVGTTAKPACISYSSDGTNFSVVPSTILPGQVIPNIVGSGRTASGTTDTLASTDCGTTVRYTNASAVTVTIPQGLPLFCNISIEQAGAGQVAVNGSAVTPATLHSAHSYTKTFAQWAVINIFTESSNVAVLTGDGA